MTVASHMPKSKAIFAYYCNMFGDYGSNFLQHASWMTGLINNDLFVCTTHSYLSIIVYILVILGILIVLLVVKITLGMSLIYLCTFLHNRELSQVQVDLENVHNIKEGKQD